MPRRQLPLFPAQPASPDEISKHTPLGATLDLFQQYLAKEGKTEHTIKAFIGDIELLGDHTGIDTPIGEYTTTKLNEFLDWMEFRRGVPCSRKTYARRVTSIKVYFKWLRAIGAITHDPALAVLQRSGPAPLSAILSPPQIRSAIYAAQRMKRGEELDTRPEMLFQLLLETGIKKSEAERLTLEDIERDPVQSALMIRHRARNVYKERRITISDELLAAIDAYIVQYHPQTTLFTCTTRNLEYILTDIGEQADIPFKLSFEVMRWTCAVRDTRHGMDEEVVREKLGLSRTSWYETNSKIRRLIAQQVDEEMQLRQSPDAN